MDVGEVIQVYDSDKKFPAWGFGGRMYNGPVSHCFNLSGNTEVCNSVNVTVSQSPVCAKRRNCPCHPCFVG